MEAAGYLRIVGRRWWVVALVAAGALLVSSLVYLVFRPRAYVATAAVVVPVPPTAAVIPATTQAVADLVSVVDSRVLAARVAARLRLDAGEVLGSLDAGRVGAGGLVEVRFEHRDPTIAERGAVEAAREALTMLAQARLAPYEERLRLAEEGYDEATSAVRAFLVRFGSIQPQADFDRVSALIGDLRERADAARNEGDVERAEELEGRIGTLTERWAPLVVEWQELSATRSRAQRQLESAQSEYAVVRAVLSAAATGTDPVMGSPAVAVGRGRAFIRSVLPIVVLATALAILLVVGVELAAGGRAWSMGAVPVVSGERRPRN